MYLEHTSQNASKDFLIRTECKSLELRIFSLILYKRRGVKGLQLFNAPHINEPLTIPSFIIFMVTSTCEAAIEDFRE